MSNNHIIGKIYKITQFTWSISPIISNFKFKRIVFVGYCACHVCDFPRRTSIFKCFLRQPCNLMHFKNWHQIKNYYFVCFKPLFLMSFFLNDIQILNDFTVDDCFLFTQLMSLLVNLINLLFSISIILPSFM